MRGDTTFSVHDRINVARTVLSKDIEESLLRFGYISLNEVIAYLLLEFDNLKAYQLANDLIESGVKSVEALRNELIKNTPFENRYSIEWMCFDYDEEKCVSILNYDENRKVLVYKYYDFFNKRFDEIRISADEPIGVKDAKAKRFLRLATLYSILFPVLSSPAVCHTENAFWFSIYLHDLGLMPYTLLNTLGDSSFSFYLPIGNLNVVMTCGEINCYIYNNEFNFHVVWDYLTSNIHHNLKIDVKKQIETIKSIYNLRNFGVFLEKLLGNGEISPSDFTRDFIINKDDHEISGYYDLKRVKKLFNFTLEDPVAIRLSFSRPSDSSSLVKRVEIDDFQIYLEIGGVERKVTLSFDKINVDNLIDAVKRIIRYDRERLDAKVVCKFNVGELEVERDTAYFTIEANPETFKLLINYVKLLHDVIVNRDEAYLMYNNGLDVAVANTRTFGIPIYFLIKIDKLKSALYILSKMREAYLRARGKH